MNRTQARSVQASAKIVAPNSGRYEPATELRDWAYRTFIAAEAPLCNPDHCHLQSAKVEFLWAPRDEIREGTMLLGCAQLGPPSGKLWVAEQREQQLEDWFGYIPDFLITVNARYWADAETSDANRCALTEHECYHCAIKKDQFGCSKFMRDGTPIWAMRPHDVEEFVGVAARYGAEGTHTEAFAAALALGPTIAKADIRRACGTCLGR